MIRHLLRLASVLTLVVGSNAAQAADVGPGVEETLRTQGVARVIIVFDLPVAARTQGPQNLATPSMRAMIEAESEAILEALPEGFELRHRFESINALAGTITADGLRRLLENPNVVRVDLDVGGTGHLAEAIPLSLVDTVQGLGLTGAGVTVAVLDSGYDSDHADLSDDLSAEACFCSGGGGCCPNNMSTQTGAGSAEDDHGHGTNVTGIITSAGTVAPLGGASDVDIVAVKVLDSTNSFCCSSDVIAGLNWVINNRPDVDIVNMSLGTSALFTGNCDNANATTMAFATAINTLRANGIPVFVSAGNNALGTQMPAPACIANALSIGAVWDSNVGSQTVLGCTDATTAADQVTCFSNSNTTTDLFAPGAPMTSTGIGGGTSTFFGTSQASPLAAACAALLLEDSPTLTPAAIEAALETSPTMVTDATNGLMFPRLDCEAAFIAATGNQPPVALCLDAEVSTDPGVCQAAMASIDGGSSDPEGGPLILSQSPPGLYPLGSTPVTLTVTDDVGLTDTCSATVTVNDTEPPTIACPADLQAECVAAGGVPATDPAIAAFLGGLTSSDNCDVITTSNDAPDFFNVGTTPVTFTATDLSGNSASCTAVVTVVDTTTPTLSVSLDPDLLWPPNHKLREISASVDAADVCTPSPDVELLSIASSEPDNGVGDGNTVNDIQGAALGTDDRTFQLRAERAGKGPGRTYTVTYAATDDAGNQTIDEATVTVPKSFGQ